MKNFLTIFGQEKIRVILKLCVNREWVNLMPLIKCPECGKEVSDKSISCINCGYPILDYVCTKEREFAIEEEKRKLEIESLKPYYFCKICNTQNEVGEDYCESCGTRLTPYNIYNKKLEPEIESEAKVEDVEIPFMGVYKYNFFGQMREVYCPRCGSENCSHYQEHQFIQGKVKTSYRINLNPFKPFTIINKKEKIKRPDQFITNSKFICNACGKIFS